MDIKERLDLFTHQVKSELLLENEKIVNDFIDYWTEHSVNAKKFRAEKEKVFCIRRRFNTWIKNQKKWFPETSVPLQRLTAYEQAKKELLG